MSSPISEGLLVHSVTLNPKASEDDYGNPVGGTPVNLTKVRVSVKKRYYVSATGETVSDDATLFYDCTFSLPVGTVFNKGDKVTYKSVDYCVREVSDPSGDESGAHHYRIALVGS